MRRIPRQARCFFFLPLGLCTPRARRAVSLLRNQSRRRCIRGETRQQDNLVEVKDSDAGASTFSSCRYELVFLRRSPGFHAARA